MNRMSFIHATKSRQSQRGISMYIVLMVVLMSMLLMLWASRTAWFNEIIVGNDADYQRAYEAAQAMLQDAELDIRREQADGTICVGINNVCRTTTPVHFVAEDKEIGTLFDSLGTQDAICLSTPCNTGCSHGICQKRIGAQDFWNDPVMLAAMTQNNVGARYGDFTGAAPGVVDTLQSNPILNNITAANRGAWYWIEVMPYSSSLGTGGLMPGSGENVVSLHVVPNVIYRITAIAYGQKASTMVVLQQTYVRQKLKD